MPVRLVTSTPYAWNLASATGFLVWEFPSVYISQKLPVAKFLGVNILLWGAVVMLHAVARTFQQFFALRFILGMLSAANGRFTLAHRELI